MSTNLESIKKNAETLQSGLFKLGRNRIVALPAHTAFDLTDELEKVAAELIRQIDAVAQGQQSDNAG